MAIALTSSGVTNSRPLSQAQAFAAWSSIADPRGDTPHAAPPDDGHAGHFTGPSDTLAVEGPGELSPPLHVDPSRTGTIDRQYPGGGVGVAMGTLFLIALVGAAIVVVLLITGG